VITLGPISLLKEGQMTGKDMSMKVENAQSAADMDTSRELAIESKSFWNKDLGTWKINFTKIEYKIQLSENEPNHLPQGRNRGHILNTLPLVQVVLGRKWKLLGSKKDVQGKGKIQGKDHVLGRWLIEVKGLGE
jgi:hypothetical protein